MHDRRFTTSGIAFALGTTVCFAPAQGTTVVERERAWQAHLELDRTSPFRELAWRCVGPMQAGCKVEAIAVPPGNHGTIYVGVGSGNVWKTRNNGTTWTPVFENESTFAIGDVAVAASDPDVVWVGTGETQPRHSGPAYAGDGVFRSGDGGATWRNTGLRGTHHIGKVAVHPRDPDTVWVAAIGHFFSSNDERGVFKTEDGGQTWDKVLFVSEHTGAVDLAVDPSDPDRLYAALWQRTGPGTDADRLGGPESGIFRSTDGGATWEKLTRGLPERSGRAGLDVCPSEPNVVYAFVDNHAPPVERRRQITGGELYRSDDRGDSWRKVNADDLYPVFGVYGWKFCDVRVSPDDSDRVYILGNRAFRSVDGGRTFERIGERIVRVHDTRGEIMHLDHHEIWIDPLNPDRILLGNDGGLFQSYDGAETWLHLNNIPAAEFYAVSVDMGDPYRIFGGTQDNAALYGPSDVDVTTQDVDPWENVYLDRWTGGDSFATILDPTDERFVYYEHQHGAMRRMDITGESVQSGGPSATSIRPRAPKGEEPWRFGWNTPFFVSAHDPRTVYAGANKVLKSTDRGGSWTAISPDLSNPAQGSWGAVPHGTITTLCESRLDRALLWAGTEGGDVHVTRDGGRSWTPVHDGLPRKWVSRVVASSHVAGRAYVALTGYREDDFAAYLFASEDHGARWTSIRGDLPDESINVVREDPTDARILYVGTDLGVHVSIDRGTSWMSLSATLPTTPVHDLVVHPRESEIVIGTHGRSAWVLDVSAVREHARK